MPHIEGTFRGAEGVELYYRCWQPLEPAKAVFGIVHGLGSHSGLFNTVVDALIPRGYVVYGFDLRGHGRSPGRRGFINRWDDFRGDFNGFWQLMNAQNPACPCFTMGHSLGAIIILDYALRQPEPLPGIITMAPALKPIGVPPVKMAIGQVLSWAWPQFTLNTGIPKNAGSRDDAIINAYLNDPMRHTKGTARLASEFIKTTRWIEANLHRLNSPVLTLHGTHDQVALPVSSEILMQLVQVEDKQYCQYPGAYHDLHNDIVTQTVVTDIANWLDRHVDYPLSLSNPSHDHPNVCS